MTGIITLSYLIVLVFKEAQHKVKGHFVKSQDASDFLMSCSLYLGLLHPFFPLFFHEVKDLALWPVSLFFFVF